MRLADTRPSIDAVAVRVFAVLCAATLAAIVVLGLFAAPVARMEEGTGAAAMIDVAPGGLIDPADVPDSVAVLYHAASEHAETYADLPCFCGCEAMLNHRNLLDCFARPEGGWEAHALGCGVCLGEAEQVEQLLAQGVTDPDRIKDAVVARWGDPYQ